MKIGFLDRRDASWTAGASYTRSVVNALAAAATPDTELFLIHGETASVGGLPNVSAVAMAPDRPPSQEVTRIVTELGIDVLLPVTGILPANTPCALLGWIPDFQHRHLPQYFTEEQRQQRDRHFGYLIDNCDAMMFSSRAALADFHEFYPAAGIAGATVPFTSSLAYQPEMFAADPRGVTKEYGLPEAFALVVNQFWKHKNHRLVVEAISRARTKNPSVHVVMVGMLSDSRDVTNPHLSELFRRLSVEKLHPHVSVLGEVPFNDLCDLLRCAVEVVQPSEFEGWNTSVEDAIALGKPVACSEIPTHREQAPGAAFFGVNDAEALAEHWLGLEWDHGGWSGFASEADSLAHERERGRGWGADLLGVCETAIAHFQSRSQSRENWARPIDEIKRHPLSYIEHLEKENVRLQDSEKRQRERGEQLQGQIREHQAKAEQWREKAGTLQQRLTQAEARYRYEEEKPLRERLADAVRRRLRR